MLNQKSVRSWRLILHDVGKCVVPTKGKLIGPEFMNVLQGVFSIYVPGKG